VPQRPARPELGAVCEPLLVLLRQDGVCCKLGARLCRAASWRGFGAEWQRGKQGSIERGAV